jgi:adenosylcobyric acid synthase
VTVPSTVDYDFVILPGTKSTMADLAWLRSQGLAEWIAAEHQRGATIIGICGGFQMLGARITDPAHVESITETMDGLALLPVTTELAAEKRTRVVSAKTPGGAQFGAYEIHVGVTTIVRTPDQRPFALVDDGEDGVWGDGIIGTYLHGAFENPAVCREVFGVDFAGVSKREHYDRLGVWFGEHVRHLDGWGFGGLSGV